MIMPPITQLVTEPLSVTDRFIGSFPSIMSFPSLVAVPFKLPDRVFHSSSDISDGVLQRQISSESQGSPSRFPEVKFSDQYLNGHLGLHMHWSARPERHGEADCICALAYKAEAGNRDRYGEDREMKARSQHLPMLVNDVEPMQEPEGMPRRSRCRPIDTFVRLQSLKRCLDSLPPHLADTIRPRTLESRCATSDRELPLVVWLSIRTDQSPNQMVKGAPIIVEAVADDWLPSDWNAARVSDLMDALTGSRIVLDHDAIWWAFPESGQLAVQLRTVFLAPGEFGFRARKRVTHDAAFG